MAILKKRIILTEIQKKEITNLLNEENKLACIDAVNVSKKINIKTSDMSDACKSMDIKITNCELGVFGKLNMDTYSKTIYDDVASNFKETTDVSCAKLWNISKNYTLRELGSTVKNSDIEVINCKLGCFTLRKAHRES